MNEGLIRRLHTIVRPFLLRRLKRDVEKQLPGKFEHTVMCPLSRRQLQVWAPSSWMMLSHGAWSRP